jgi:hypothetical protein
MKMDVRICFKIPGEDVTVSVATVREPVSLIRESYTLSCIAHIWLNGRKFHFGGNL